MTSGITQVAGITAVAGSGGVASSIAGLITPGTNITLAGGGTAGSPYVISSTGTPAGSDRDIQFNNAGAFGATSGFSFTPGERLLIPSALFNTFINSANESVAGSYNTGVGLNALASNNGGSFNNAFGVQALYSNTGGNGNFALGVNALYFNINGSNNLGIGLNTFFYNVSGSSSVAIGYASGLGVNGVTNTSNNAFIGYNSGATITTGGNNTYIGYSSGNTDGSVTTPGTLTNATAIGYNAQVTASNSLVLGGTGSYAVNVGIGTTSPTIGALQVSGGSSFTTFPANTTAFGQITSTTGWMGQGFLFSSNVANDAFSMVYNSVSAGNGVAYFGNLTNTGITSWFSATAANVFIPSTLSIGTNASSLGVLTINSNTTAFTIGITDPTSGAWIRNDGSNTVFSTNVGSLYFGYGGNTSKNLNFGNNGSSVIISGSAPSNSLNVISSGNVGIGTPSPASLFSVGSTSQFQVSTSGNIVNINGVATAGIGVPAIRASGRFTAQTAANASIATFTPTADGSFDISANVLVTTSTLHNFSFVCNYTDEGNNARVLTITFTNLGGTLLTAITNTGGTVPYEGLTTRIRAKGGTSITLATTGTFTTVTYNVEGTVAQVT